MSLKTNVLETLASTPIRWINFTFANRLISPIGYYFVASLVSNGKIECGVDGTLVHTAKYDVLDNKITASDGSYGETYFDEKSLLVHECTHALLDCFYNGRDMNGKTGTGITVQDDETIAYIAQAIYVIAAKGAIPTSDASPDYHAIQAIRPKVDAMLKRGWTGCETLAFTNTEVASLRTAIQLHTNYKDDYKSIAVHNGSEKPKKK